MSGSSGAAYGRLGGLLSGGARSRKSLANAQRVRIVEPNSAPSLSTTIAGKVEVLRKTQKRRKSAGDRPDGMSAGREALLEIAASAARAAESAVAAAASAQAAAEAKEPPPPSKRSANSNKPAPLFSAKRGEVVGMIVSATYGARKTYDWDDIVDVGQKIASGALTMADINHKDENGNWVQKVPYTTMDRWIKDDHAAMSKKKPPGAGVRGQPHWKVELEVRRRTSLSRPGGCGGGKQAVLGQVRLVPRSPPRPLTPPSLHPVPPCAHALTRSARAEH